MNKLEIKNITKCFGENIALDNISTTFEKGKIYALLGANGAGKSTLIKLICNRLIQNEGMITLDGENVFENEKAQAKIAVMNDSPTYIASTKVKGFLKYVQNFNSNFDIEKAERLIKMFDLNKESRYNALSTGYKSIFKLIMAICSNASCIILDEPILGLDANYRDVAYKVILETFVESNCCMIISTHLIEEISNMVDHVVIIKDGKIIEDMNKDELLSKVHSVSGFEQNVEQYIKDKKVFSKNRFGGLLTCFVYGEKPSNEIDNIQFSTIELQRLFIELTKTKENENEIR